MKVALVTGGAGAVGAATAILRLGWLAPQIIVGYFAQAATRRMPYYALGAFGRAACIALKEWPAVNGEIYGDEIIYKNYYNIGVAVGSPKGLVVPVLKDADKMGFADIEGSISDFGRRARDGKLGIDEMMGGTFTISNGGVFGSLNSMPILNVPQSAILGMHKIEKRAVVVDDEIVIRPMMYLALSYDHRIIDGKESVGFLVAIKEAIENPVEHLMDGDLKKALEL